MIPDPSLRSGFRLRAPASHPITRKARVLGAPASLTPAKRLNLTRGDLVGDGFGEDVNLTHGGDQ